MRDRIGFMQGRFSPLINGRIQAFPWEFWQDEFIIAQENQFNLMEWTLDQEMLYDNPLLTFSGQSKIKNLCEKYSIEIASLTGDCFMQSPFWKKEGVERESLQNDFVNIIEASSNVGISMVVLPLVDTGRLESLEQENILIDFLQSKINFFKTLKVKIIFESDFASDNLIRFIDSLDPEFFGLNYDVGNSASLGMNPSEEIETYGHRIMNVHIKDRLLGGTTVPLGFGNANFDAVFSALAKINYSGNYILQTARDKNNEHTKVLCEYRNLVSEWIVRYGA